jgi:hypothetical protein
MKVFIALAACIAGAVILIVAIQHAWGVSYFTEHYAYVLAGVLLLAGGLSILVTTFRQPKP